MSDDPVRLLDEEGSELLHTLLGAAREEQPQDAALRRTLSAVGIGTALTTAGGATGSAGALGSATLGKGAATSTLVTVVKWLSVGALTGTVASSALYGVSAALAPSVPSVALSTPAPPAPVTPPRPPRASTAVTDIPEIPRPPAVIAPPSSVPAAPAASPLDADSGPSLAAEVAALDGVRHALSAGDAARVLLLLNDYEARFPAARMLPEALYLRLEAFTLEGDKSDAQAVARRILLVYPSSPHAARARAVLGLDK